MCKFNNGPPDNGDNQLRANAANRNLYFPQFSKNNDAEWINSLTCLVVSICQTIFPKWIIRFRIRGPRGWQVDFHCSVE
ncbi:hypothetical protein Lepto7375DRAFT_3235 [Leptolyngbya sp. PCC 7375]|nr:hypothetical protein Lepto7375DRAFT_3235 [Leptolyngbya sp. PCC 7375]